MNLYTTIIDNFYEDPLMMRNYALSHEFYYRNELPFIDIDDATRLSMFDNPGYIGMRTIRKLNDTKIINNLKKIIQCNQISSVYHIVLDEDNQNKETDFHQDIYEQNIAYIAIVYLHPKPNPQSGTILSNNDDTKMYIENKFNRIILYDPSIWHKSNNGFGLDKDSGRLTQVIKIYKNV